MRVIAGHFVAPAALFAVVSVTVAATTPDGPFVTRAQGGRRPRGGRRRGA